MAVVLPIIHENSKFKHPFQVSDQHFGTELNLDDLLASMNETTSTCPAAPKSASNCTTTNNDFKVNLDVEQFKPEELTVKVTDKNTITVEAKHEEKEDDDGFVSRHFVRKYVVPDGHDISKVVSSLSSDGVLSLTVPCISKVSDKERTITVQQTGVPSKYN